MDPVDPSSYVTVMSVSTRPRSLYRASMIAPYRSAMTPPADLPGASDLPVVRVELLVEDEEAPDPGSREGAVRREAPVDPVHLAMDEVVHLVLLREVLVAGVRNPPALRPVLHRLEVDVDDRRHILTVLPEGHRFLDVRGELELVLEELGREHGAVVEMAHVPSPDR